MKFPFFLFSVCSFVSLGQLGAAETVRWPNRIPRNREWLVTDEARGVADNLLLYQFPSGGWPKNIDMAAPLTDAQKAELAARAELKSLGEHGATIDNGATTSEIRFLARMFAATGEPRFRESVLRGLEYLLAAQHSSGGWPQFFPHPRDYAKHITFNDNAMVEVLTILRDVSTGTGTFAFTEVSLRRRAADAVSRGIDCILKCQIRTGGELTVWCAQHDENTYAAAEARKFEPACLASHESSAIAIFLMGIETPSPDVIAAVNAAIAWFEKTRIEGLRFDFISTAEGKDGIVTPDPAAPPVWARFYEIGTNRPIFAGRDAIVRYALAEIERERRGGYAWYVQSPAEALKRHAAWTAKLSGAAPVSSAK
jgi:PelA/Pel-15E family pectate lyase